MIEVNFVAVLFAAVAAMVVGFVYYSPFVLGKPWMKLMGMTSPEMKPKGNEMAKLYGTSFILSLITAYVLVEFVIAQIMFGSEPDSLFLVSLMSGFFMWLGFVMPVQATEVLFSKKPVKLFAINTGYQLVSLLVMGVVIGLLR